MKNHSAAGSRTNQNERALRVALAYEGESLRVLSRQSVAMRTLPSDPLQANERESGFWFQVEDSNKNTLYRRVMDNPLRFDTETPTDDPRRPLYRVPLEKVNGVFHLLVPLSMSNRADTVRIFSSPLDPKGSTQPAREIFEFPVVADVAGEGRPSDRPQGGSSNPG